MESSAENNCRVFELDAILCVDVSVSESEVFNDTVEVWWWGVTETVTDVVWLIVTVPVRCCVAVPKESVSVRVSEFVMENSSVTVRLDDRSLVVLVE
jgi:hypothetical protein